MVAEPAVTKSYVYTVLQRKFRRPFPQCNRVWHLRLCSILSALPASRRTWCAHDSSCSYMLNCSQMTMAHANDCQFQDMFQLISQPFWHKRNVRNVANLQHSPAREREWCQPSTSIANSLWSYHRERCKTIIVNLYKTNTCRGGALYGYVILFNANARAFSLRFQTDEVRDAAMTLTALMYIVFDDWNFWTTFRSLAIHFGTDLTIGVSPTFNTVAEHMQTREHSTKYDVPGGFVPCVAWSRFVPAVCVTALKASTVSDVTGPALAVSHVFVFRAGGVSLPRWYFACHHHSQKVHSDLFDVSAVWFGRRTRSRHWALCTSLSFPPSVCEVSIPYA